MADAVNATTGTRAKPDEFYKSVGVAYPLIRINDHYFTRAEIVRCVVSVMDFVPTIDLEVYMNDKLLLQSEMITEGSICSIYFAESNDSALIKPARADFRITDVSCKEPVSQLAMGAGYNFRMFGELNVPDLYNAGMSYSFMGSSRDCLIDAAQRLGLGFAFCNPDDTNDMQLWQCTPLASGGMISFIKDVTSSAWMDKNHFFDSWIDIRYDLVFLDVNTMLGWEGFDDGLDVTQFMTHLYNQKLGKDKDKIENKRLVQQAKLFTNMNLVGDEAMTSFFVAQYKLVNQATSVTRSMGMRRGETLAISNNGIAQEDSSFDMSYRLALNYDKLKNGYYALLGPTGQAQSYTSADGVDSVNSKYAESEYYKSAEKIVEVNSDGDDAVMRSTGDNMLSSGNVSKTYDIAKEHNRINNMQLEKQFIMMECPGINLRVMRGEKVPVAILERDSALTSVMSFANSDKAFDRTASGWFMIAGIEYEYNTYAPVYSTEATQWVTRLKMTRREWPIPTYYDIPSDGDNQDVINCNTAAGSSVEGAYNNAGAGSSGSASTQADDGTGGEETTQGLESYIKDIYEKIQSACDGKVKISMGRLYAVDSDGNIIEAYTSAKTRNESNGLYQCRTSGGKTVYISEPNSSHLYGRAVNIVSDGISMDELLIKIVDSESVLSAMFAHGVSLHKETNSVDNSVTYYVGTDTEYQDAWWSVVMARLNTTTLADGTNLKSYASRNKLKTS